MVLVAAGVGAPLMLPLEMELPVLVEVAIGDDGAERSPASVGTMSAALRGAGVAS